VHDTATAELSFKRLGRVVTIGEQETVAAAAEKMRRDRVGSVVVVGPGDQVIGIITERDIISKIVAHAVNPAIARVSEVMVREVISCAPNTLPHTAEELMVRHGIRHLPIVEDGRVQGMISSRDLVAHQLAVTEAMKAAAEEVAEMSKGLRMLDLDEVADLIVRSVPGLFDAKCAALRVSDEGAPSPGARLLRRQGCPCLDEGPLSARVTCGDAWFDALGRTVTTADYGNDDGTPGGVKGTQGTTAVVIGDVPATCVQLGARPPRVVLSLTLAKNTQTEDAWAEGCLCLCCLPTSSVDDRELMQYKGTLVAGIVSAHLTHAWLYQRAYRDSRTDPLTGLGTRRVLEERLQAEYDRALRCKHPFSVVFIDVDNFKEVNDLLGHAVGDQALRKLSTLLRQQARAVDTVVRFGGDEFVWLMPETGMEGARTAVTRLQRKVEAMILPGDCRITISAGVATCTEAPEETAASVLKRADESLYQAKRAGRNRILTG
jgi:diguanylate cyclase (GGDEF)-like protein